MSAMSNVSSFDVNNICVIYSLYTCTLCAHLVTFLYHNSVIVHMLSSLEDWVDVVFPGGLG